jgi:hypothetical protein
MEKKSENLVSRKGAKAAKKLNFRTWRAWRLGAINFLAIRVLGVMCGMG